jgi:hypothetical protein
MTKPSIQIRCHRPDGEAVARGTGLDIDGGLPGT